MAYDRDPRTGDRGGYNDRNDLSGYGRDRGGDDRYGASTQRGYGAGNDGRDDDGRRDGQRAGGYGAGAQSEWRGQDAGGQSYGQRDVVGGRDYYRGDNGQREQSQGQRYGNDTYRQQRGTYDRQPQSYQSQSYQSQSNRGDDDRGFMARAGDEVRSWFGDEDAERRRERDARDDERGNQGRDEHYHDWRNKQIAAFDRDYHEYRQENQSKFHNEFASFRTERQGQRDLLDKVEEHAEVLGSDGEHVGTVDKVRGDRIILTKSDADAGGQHHSIPSRWLQSAEANRITLRKTAAEAKAHWRDEERSNAMFGQDEGRQSEDGRRNESGESTGGTNLNRSFSGTY